MMRQGCTVVMLVAAAMAAGCGQIASGKSRSLGAVDYSQAFAAAAEVMRQNYSVDSADAETGAIKASPQPVKAGRERLMGGSPAREQATMLVRREGNEVVAYASVVRQRMSGPTLRDMSLRTDTYDTVPNATPAEREAATTAEQNESWTSRGHAIDVERRLLDDVYKALHPKK
jgi:hypothetical protein